MKQSRQITRLFRQYVCNPGWILIFSCLLVIQGSLPQEQKSISSGSSVKEIIDNLNQHQGLITAATGVLRWSKLGESVMAPVEGRFFFAFPLKFRIDLSEPERRQIISDGHSFWIFDPDSSHASQFEWSQSASVVKLLTSKYAALIPNLFFVLGEHWQYSLRDVLDGIYVVRATPPEAIENISQILIKVDPKKSQILAWELLDQENNLILRVIFSSFTKVGQLSFFPGKIQVYRRLEKTTSTEEIKFKKLSLNPAVDPSVFRFKSADDGKIYQP